jgi:hypothetical protein
MVAACVWDYAAGMQMLRVFWDAARTLDPRAASLDEGARFPICTPTRLGDTMRAAGFLAVAVGEIVIDTVFTSFADYWSPFLEGVGPAGTYVTALDDRGREALAQHVRARLPIDSSGTLALTARAWTVCGRPPATDYHRRHTSSADETIA